MTHTLSYFSLVSDARFIELYPILQQQTDKRVDYVDLRYDSGGAVGWAPLLLDVNE